MGVLLYSCERWRNTSEIPLIFSSLLFTTLFITYCHIAAIVINKYVRHTFIFYLENFLSLGMFSETFNLVYLYEDRVIAPVNQIKG